MTFIISFLLYLLTITPTIYWRDAPEFQDIAYSLGIGHPAGSPLYIMISKFFTYIPIGNLYFRANLVSAVFGALTVYILEKIIFEITNKKIISFGLSLLFGLSFPFWLKAVTAEVYTMNAFFLVIIIYLIFLFYNNRETKYIIIASFLFGLSSGVHAGVALFLPAFLYIYIVLLKKEAIKYSLSVSFFFLLGFSVFIYLPLRAIHWPQFNWGNPQTISNFLYQITDAKDSGGRISSLTGNGSFFSILLIYFKNILTDLTPVIPVLAFLGIYKLFKDNFHLLIFILLISGFNTFFFIGWKSGIPLLPSYIMYIILAAYGITLIISFDKKDSYYNAILITLFFSLLITIFISFPKVNKKDYFLPREMLMPDFVNFNKDAVILSDYSYFPYRAIQDLERTRDDLKILTYLYITQPEASSPIDSQRFPGIIINNKFDDSYEEIRDFIRKNIKINDIYVEASPSMDFYNSIFKDFYPQPFEKFYLKLNTKNYPFTQTETNKYFKRFTNYIERDIDVKMFTDREETIYIIKLFQGIGTYFQINHKPFITIIILKIIKKWFGDKLDLTSYYNDLASAYIDSGRYKEAKKILYLAIKKVPSAYYNLAVIAYREHKFKEAISFLDKIKKPEDCCLGSFFFVRGKSLYMLKDFKRAEHNLMYVLKFSKDKTLQDETNNFIYCIKREIYPCSVK